MVSCNISDYDVVVELANCCHKLATVYLAKCNLSYQQIVIKKYAMDKAKKDEHEMVRNEIHIMRQLNHPNLHNFYKAFLHDTELYLVSPYMKFGSCHDLMVSCFPTGLPEPLIATIMRDVLCGLEYMHRQSYVHRAIRASHILLSGTKAVLSGFRETTNIISHGKRVNKLHTLAKLSENSLNWLAPEVLEQNLIGYTEKSDIYSIGITCCELANGTEPFFNAQPTYMLIEKINGHTPTLFSQTSFPLLQNEQFDNIDASQINHSFSADFQRFAEICLDKRAANRWSAFELQHHSFIKQCRHTSLYNQLQRLRIDVLDFSHFEEKKLKFCNGITDKNVKSDDCEWNF